MLNTVPEYKLGHVLAFIKGLIADERSDVKVCKVNVDDEQELAVQFKVMSIPTLLVFKDGKVVNQSLGAKPKAAILAMLD